ncbi:hypothetical protein BASA61_003255 [Batrachochytrium salamandrivorans]|nr:hypothetical protein BASA60_008678 [Batrachochytrium salamandrivorans]KAH6597120.1 hypothetical protein BASA61_003255 [Batrachochytrium salamandrivorans]
MIPDNLSEAISQMAAERALASTKGPHANIKRSDEELVEDVLSTPLFMSRLSGDDGLEDEALLALQSLSFDGTPIEVAENFKHQGNAAYAEGHRKYKDAIVFYTKGLAVKADDSKLNSILHSNRAAVNLDLGNYRQVLNDCAAAIRLNPNNIKAFFRSAKALLALDRISEGIDCCELGISLDPANKALCTELQKLKHRKNALDSLEAKRNHREQLKRDEEDQLQNAISTRGYRMVNSVRASGDDNDKTSTMTSLLHPLAADHKIKFDSTTLSLKLPVLFLYPEHRQSDFIAEFDENDSFYQHMELMFEDPISWDPQHNYHPQSLEILFETHESVTPKEKQSLISVLHSVKASGAPSQSATDKYVYMTLKDVLQHQLYRIVDGVCTFLIVVRGSEFSRSFKRRYAA